LGLIKCEIYVDTSFCNGTCQSGFVIKHKSIEYAGSSSIFHAPDNNTAEMIGMQLASEEALILLNNEYVLVQPSYYFDIYNDNISATTFIDVNYKLRIEETEIYKTTHYIKEWFQNQNIYVKCHRMKRNRPQIKKCDKLSKVYRKKGKRL
jgi:ribonuclease HI